MAGGGAQGRSVRRPVERARERSAVSRVDAAEVAVGAAYFQGDFAMKGILAWAIGLPIPIIILLYLFDVF
jgi:hypothetical protein